MGRKEGALKYDLHKDLSPHLLPSGSLMGEGFQCYGDRDAKVYNITTLPYHSDTIPQQRYHTTRSKYQIKAYPKLGLSLPKIWTRYL